MPHPAPILEAPPAGLPSGDPEGCANCGAPLTGPFCARCGQEARERVLSLRQLLSEFVDAIVGIDSRLVRTLWPLVRRPGHLTNEYVAGRRARYVAPLRLYLVASFLLFFTVTLLGTDFGRLNFDAPAAASDTTQAERLSPGVPAPPADGIDVTGIIDVSDADSAELAQSRALRWAYRASIRINEDPQTFKKALIDRIPVMMFFLLPVFALLLKLIYVRARRLYVAHLIFSLHVHAFFFIGMLGGEIVDALLRASVGWSLGNGNLRFVVPVAVVYLFLALRRVYGQSRLKTLLKLLLLCFTYFLVAGIALIVITVITALLF